MENRNFERIVVTTDFSDHSASAISLIRSYQAFREATLYLLNVKEPFRAPGSPELNLPSASLLTDANERAADEYAQYIQQHIPASLTIDAIVRHGEPATEIAKFATEIGADLIVIATHGRTGLSHMIMGSVAEKVIRLSSVPVLTVTPHRIRDGFLEETDVAQQLHLERSTDEFQISD